jgi:membrane-associated phospholipid phosphatase
MFNTNIIHFLQQFDHPLFYWFMVVVSALGTIPFILTVVFGITFAVDFKKGLIIVNIIAWTTLLTHLLKEQIDYPRPVDIEYSLIKGNDAADGLSLKELAPSSFWSFFSGELLEETRNDAHLRYGLPSGHTSIQVALWVALFFVFRKRWMAICGTAIVLLTMLSRMYLGYHFLGDVLAGVLVGLIISSALILLVIKTGYLGELSYRFSSLSLLWIPAILVPFANYVSLWVLGSMIGLNVAATLIILQRNFPVFHVIVWKRIVAALLTLLLISVTYYLNRNTDFSSSDFVELLIIAAINFVLIWGSIFVSNRLNLIRFRF